MRLQGCCSAGLTAAAVSFLWGRRCAWVRLLWCCSSFERPSCLWKHTQQAGFQRVVYKQGQAAVLTVTPNDAGVAMHSDGGCFLSPPSAVCLCAANSVPAFLGRTRFSEPGYAASIACHVLCACIYQAGVDMSLLAVQLRLLWQIIIVVACICCACVNLACVAAAKSCVLCLCNTLGAAVVTRLARPPSHFAPGSCYVTSCW